MYTGSTGTHMIDGSRNIATALHETVTIQSNNEPSIKLRFQAGEYYLMHNQRILFNTAVPAAHSGYASLYSGYVNLPDSADHVFANQWNKANGATDDINESGGRLATQNEAPHHLQFNGGELGEGIR